MPYVSSLFMPWRTNILCSGTHMPSRKQTHLFLGTLLLATNIYAQTQSGLRDENQASGFLKRAKHAVLNHPPMKDFLSLFPRKKTKPRPVISNPIPQQQGQVPPAPTITPPRTPEYHPYEDVDSVRDQRGRSVSEPLFPSSQNSCCHSTDGCQSV